jgi:hypothetical protein
MIMRHPTQEQIATGQSYLMQAFPGARQRSWWEEDRMAQIFALTDGAVLRHIVIDGGLFHACPDYAAALRDSEFTDYVRETRSPARCFHLTWEAGALHIRSKPL